MSFCLPARVEDALWRVAGERLPAAALVPGALGRAVVERSRRYTSARELLAAPLPPAEAALDLAARALFFTVADAPKILVPLAELGGRGLLPEVGASARVLDLGAGVGAMTIGAIAGLPGRRLHLRALDRDRGALSLLDAAVPAAAAALDAAVELETERADVARAPIEPESFDLVLLGSVMNELDPAARLPLAERAIAGLRRGGAVVLIEPALREVARALHRLRDEVIERHLASVFAPCTRRLAPCPALADERDWCHEDRPTELPPRAARLAAATGLREYGLKFAYLVLRRGAESLVEDQGRSAWRVVSRPRKLKGARECFACSDEGRLRLRLLKRHRGPNHQGFEDCRRGDILLRSGASGPEIEAEERVERRSPVGG